MASLTKEIERKWLLGNVDALLAIRKNDSVYIEQRYFQEPNEERTVARVRQYSEIEIRPGKCNRLTVIKSEITTKSGRGIERGEHNVPIDHQLASNIMITHMDEVTIQKVRYTLPTVDTLGNKLVIEVDVYEDLNKGLVHIEVEFPSLEVANAFVALDWFGEEVTDDMRHTNSALQEKPYQWWPETREFNKWLVSEGRTL